MQAHLERQRDGVRGARADAVSSRYLRLGTGAESAFEFSEVPETLVAFDANMTGADLTLNGDKVINLGDASLTQFTQGSDGARLVLATAGDGKLEMTCDGSNDEMALVSNITMNPSSFRIWSVLRTTGGTRVMYRSISGTNINRFANFMPDIEVSRSGIASRYDDDPDPRSFTDSVHHLFEHSFGGTNANHLMDIDGVTELWNNNPAASNPGTASISVPWNICSFPGFFFMNGAYRAKVICSPDPSAANAALIRAKLNADWF